MMSINTAVRYGLSAILDMHNELVVSKSAIVSIAVAHFDVMLLQMCLKCHLGSNCFITSQIVLMMNIGVPTEVVHKHCCFPIPSPSEFAFELTLKLIY
eukprot:3159103-Ditylum_brightwellii.AAC.1